MKKRTMQLCRAAIIAALYVVLTYLSTALGLAAGPIQLRLSEILCILPLFTPAAIPGLFIGCLLANILSGSILEILIGSLATLMGAYGTYLIGKTRLRYFAALPPIASNTVIIPIIYIGAYGVSQGFFMIALGVFICELISVGIFGTLLIPVLDKYRSKLF